MTLAVLDEAVAAGARLGKACELPGLAERTVKRWRTEPGSVDRRAESGAAPAHKLTAAERDTIVRYATSAEYRDLSPRQIVPLLADKGVYVASESSFYRVLHEHNLMAHREPTREGVHRDGLVLHADNGGPMKGSTMLATLQRLGVVASFSRPAVSDDNPFAEALFRTMKYRPGYPKKPFASREDARTWVDGFVARYNGTHLHSGIRFVTPNERHEGRDIAILAARKNVYATARKRAPRRWTGPTRNWSPITAVRLNPERRDVCIMH